MGRWDEFQADNLSCIHVHGALGLVGSGHHFLQQSAAKMKKLLVAGGLLLTALFALGGWFFCAEHILMPSVAVRDVLHHETLVLGEKTGSRHTHGITIRGSGEVDGEATVALLLDGQPYKVAPLNGRVAFEWGGDWYSETAEIRYTPTNVRSGKVVLHYRFHQ